MSGYRSLHREDLRRNLIAHEKVAVWSVATSTLLRTSSKHRGSRTPGADIVAWRVYTATSDGYVRAYIVEEANVSTKDEQSNLDASAMKIYCTHVLCGSSQPKPPMVAEPSTLIVPTPVLGCMVVDVIRNYTGDDRDSGDIVAVGLELTGTVRIWTLSSNGDDEIDFRSADENVKPPRTVKALHEFRVDDATGTTCALAPTYLQAVRSDIVLAVGCLDGTIALVTSGLMVANTSSIRHDIDASTAAVTPGTILARYGRQNFHAIVLALCWHPTQARILATGRQNGMVDVLSTNTDSTSSHASTKNHRLIHLQNSPVRAIQYLPDGSMLVAGNDDGIMCVWDVQRPAGPVLVHHIIPSVSTTGGSPLRSWILDIVPLSDSRRFVSTHTDQSIHVWDVAKLYQPIHSFKSDSTAYCLHHHHYQHHHTKVPLSLHHDATSATSTSNLRLVAGTETGSLQIFSMAHQ
jgi:WD40 repeat protein